MREDDLMEIKTAFDACKIKNLLCIEPKNKDEELMWQAFEKGFIAGAKFAAVYLEGKIENKK